MERMAQHSEQMLSILMILIHTSHGFSKGSQAVAFIGS